MVDRNIFDIESNMMLTHGRASEGSPTLNVTSPWNLGFDKYVLVNGGAKGGSLNRRTITACFLTRSVGVSGFASSLFEKAIDLLQCNLRR